MSSQQVTLGTAITTAALFSYLASNKKHAKKAVLLLGLGCLLRQIGVYGKCDVVNNIGSTMFNSCLFTIPGLATAYALYNIGDRALIDKAFGMFIGSTASLNIFIAFSKYVKKNEKQISSSLVLAISDSQKFLKELL